MPLSDEEKVVEHAYRLLYRFARENEQLRARLVKLQEPEGEREERVADWLRGRGYKVEKHDPE